MPVKQPVLLLTEYSVGHGGDWPPIRAKTAASRTFANNKRMVRRLDLYEPHELCWNEGGEVVETGGGGGGLVPFTSDPGDQNAEGSFIGNDVVVDVTEGDNTNLLITLGNATGELSLTYTDVRGRNEEGTEQLSTENSIYVHPFLDQWQQGLLETVEGNLAMSIQGAENAASQGVIAPPGVTDPSYISWGWDNENVTGQYGRREYTTTHDIVDDETLSFTFYFCVGTPAIEPFAPNNPDSMRVYFTYHEEGIPVTEENCFAYVTAKRWSNGFSQVQGQDGENFPGMFVSVTGEDAGFAGVGDSWSNQFQWLKVTAEFKTSLSNVPPGSKLKISMGSEAQGHIGGTHDIVTAPSMHVVTDGTGTGTGPGTTVVDSPEGEPTDGDDLDDRDPPDAVIYGCTNPNASNYNPNANVDDGSCEYDIPGCTDPLANNYNENATVDDGSCTYDVPGCTDPRANNYDPTATIDDGSCEYDKSGCTDPEAVNYNENADIDDGSCIYEIPGCTDKNANNHDPEATHDDGSCEYDIPGCMDESASNYNPQATIDDGSCEYDKLGCTNPEAENYNPHATVDNGSCIIRGCMDPLANNYNPDATTQEGAVCTYRPDVIDPEDVTPYPGCTDPDARNFDPIATVDDGSCEYDIPGCTDPDALNYNPQATIDDGSCEYDILGCTDPAAINYNPDATIDDGSCEYKEIPGCTDPDAMNFNPQATVDDDSCFYDEDPPDGVVRGCTDPRALNYNSDARLDDGSCRYGPDVTDIDGKTVIITDPEKFGCTDPNALNFDPLATIDDGSCKYDDVPGCTDPAALNFNPLATIDDGSCIYPPEYVFGCTDPDAINFDGPFPPPPVIVIDDGSCIYTGGPGIENPDDPEVVCEAHEPYALTGSTTVFIEGKEAHRAQSDTSPGDLISCGDIAGIPLGNTRVFIGG